MLLRRAVSVQAVQVILYCMPLFLLYAFVRQSYMLSLPVSST